MWALSTSGPLELSPRSSQVVERGDLDELTMLVNGLVAEGRWEELAALRERCRVAVERGKQLWPVASHVEYRLCLQGPAEWAALMLEVGTGRFSLGPLPEVAASAHTWDEVAPHLHRTPQAAMFAHERVMRGEDLSRDRSARELPEVLELPLRLQSWEPAYPLAGYTPDALDAPAPKLPALGRRAAPSREVGGDGEWDGTGWEGGAGDGPVEEPLSPDEPTRALQDLVGTWTEESNGRAEAVGAEGGATDAIAALGVRRPALAELDGRTAMALMAWAGASGGAHGRRRGSAPGRFGAWWVLAALGDLADDWPVAPRRLGEVLERCRWYCWGADEPATGWVLRLAVEVPGRSGPRSWALAATDAA